MPESEDRISITLRNVDLTPIIQFAILAFAAIRVIGWYRKTKKK